MARYVKFFGLGGGVDGFITGSCNTVQATSYLQANGPQANINVAIIPKGTGAIVAACPDETATGGNGRGIGAVDFQMSRTAADQVAGGRFDVLTGGQNNKISPHNDGYRFIGGGYQNTITVAGYSVITGGRQNSISGGGSSYNTISGGQDNIASNTHATVVGGSGNTASGYCSVAGGYGNVASGYASIALGDGSVASGYNSLAIGGANTSGTRSVALGRYTTVIGGDYSLSLVGGYVENGYFSGAILRGKTTSEKSMSIGDSALSYLRGQLSHAHSNWTSTDPSTSDYGSNQVSELITRKQATLASAATTVLSLDGTGTTNLIVPHGNNRLWSAKITATAFVSAVSGTTLVLGDSYMAEYTVLFKRVGGTSSVVGTNAGSVIADTNMISSAFTFAAGASQELAITFKAPTTANADTFRCVAKVELVEVAY